MLRPCGSNTRAENRFTKAELLGILQKHGVQVKAKDTIDELCDKVRELGQYPVAPATPFATFARQVASPRPVVAATPATVTIRDKLLARLAKLGPDEVLDVSHVDEKFEGIRKMKRAGGKSEKIGPAGLPFVSNDRNKFVQVVSALGPEYAGYINEYDDIKQSRKVVAASPRPVTATYSPRPVTATYSPRPVPTVVGGRPFVPRTPIPSLGGPTPVSRPYSPSRAGPASPVRPLSPIRTTSPVRPASPIRTTSPVRPASPIRTTSPVRVPSPREEERGPLIPIIPPMPKLK